ncbi:MAG: 3-phosphoshikimate 1-carboxyvinyltransferase [Gemmatimonadales bacterium]
MSGTHRVPGDKSITHRALLLAALAPGVSTIRGALSSLDARATARVLRQLGARISAFAGGRPVVVAGRERWRRPAAPLDCGNSGTTARLLLGVLAAHRFAATLTGDRSLRRRPMRRVTEPLGKMGARVTAAERDGLPLTIRGGDLHALDWRLPVASAQIKSCLLLAGAAGKVAVTLHQPAPSRDHTERLLRHLGFTIVVDGAAVRLEPDGAFHPLDLDIPGDISSAAFLVAAAALAPRGQIAIAGVGVNPSRTAFLGVLARMNVPVRVVGVIEASGEPRGTLIAGASDLHAVTVSAAEVPGVIDEIPMLACLAARAPGTSRFSGLAELQVKESDRLALLAGNLARVGVDAAVEGHDLIVRGTDRRLAGRVVTQGDHRIAMAFSVLGTSRGARFTIDDPACAAVSFPGFRATLDGLYRRR